MADEIHFWLFVIICFVAVFMFFDLQRSKEGYDTEGIYRMDPTDLANPDPRNMYVSLTSLQEAEDNFEPSVGPYLM
jgi:hypothetical protein